MPMCGFGWMVSFGLFWLFVCLIYIQVKNFGDSFALDTHFKIHLILEKSRFFLRQKRTGNPGIWMDIRTITGLMQVCDLLN